MHEIHGPVDAILALFGFAFLAGMAGGLIFALYKTVTGLSVFARNVLTGRLAKNADGSPRDPIAAEHAKEVKIMTILVLSCLVLCPVVFAFLLFGPIIILAIICIAVVVLAGRALWGRITK